MSEPFGCCDDPELDQLARAAVGDADAALKVADLTGAGVAAKTPLQIMRELAALGSIDLTVARVVEPHVDALIILAEAGEPAADGRWGVFAAEAPGQVLRAERTRAGWRLDGVKPWCSLADRLDRALVTATTSEGRALFAVDLRADGVHVQPSGWVSRGLATLHTAPVHFDAVAAQPVGEVGWYLRRPGFAWGGIRVAACWAGATEALYRYLRDALAGRAGPDPIRRVSLGRLDTAVWSSRLALLDAARAMTKATGGEHPGNDPAVLAARVRAVVADAAELAIREVGHALGPAPLTYDDEHARRIADLTVYVRQHHADRDLAALADLIVA